MLVLVIRTLILYTVVVISLRVMGKRQIGELQPSELVVAIMISDLAAVPMQAIDIPILTGIIPVLTLIIAEVFMSFLTLKNKKIRKFVTGEPSIVVYNGHVNEGELERLRFNMNDLLEELRISNVPNIADVEVAVLETNGKLSVIPKTDARPATVRDLNIQNAQRESVPYMLISDGDLNMTEVKRSGKSEEWLKRQLQKNHITNYKEIFIASLDENGTLFIQMKGEKDQK
jgi:uncharacterized membrane protein YcaP (DUF421 family)